MTDPTLITFEGGDVLANLEDRTITGLLVPYNEIGRTNLGAFQVEAGAIELPADPIVIGLNTDHNRAEPVGRATRVWEDPAKGIFATFQIAKTPEGDRALADATTPTGARRKLSGEFGPAIIKAGKLVAGHSKLWGSALVGAGAFPSAQVLAADTPDPAQPAQPAEPVETTETFTDDYTDENGNTHKRKTTRTTRTEPDGNGGTKTTITEKVVIEEPDPTPAQDPEEDPMSNIPNTVNPSQVQASERPQSPQHIFAAIATLMSNPADTDARQVLAALSDIKISGSGALPASGVLRENWVGPLHQGMAYVREYVTLGKLGTDISAAGKKGFKVHRGTSGSPVDSYASTGNWAGNKAAIGSGTGWTETAASVLNRFAFGDDLAREFYDLPGGAEVVESFLRLIVEDHAVWSDDKALAAWIAAAGTPIAPATYPTQYSDALGMVLQGILAVKSKKADGRRDKPSFAIVNELAYEELVYTPKDLIPEFIRFSVTTDSEGTADNDVRIVVGDIGIEDTPAALVGADYAIEFDELAGGPLFIDALNIANGGIDKAVHGYLQVFTVRPEAVVLVGVADA